MKFLLSIFMICFLTVVVAQPPHGLHWNKAGNILYTVENNNIVATAFPSMQSNVLVSAAELTPAGQSQPLHVRNFFFSNDEKKLLIYTNSKKVWRYDTRGDYWVLNLVTKNLKQLGKGKPASSLMFAKFSPDGNKVAYVCEHNIYVEDLNNNTIKPLTTNGNRYLINGTFDWVYEEEFFCRDGFRWSPDGTKIAYWQINAKNTPNYLMINNTDSAYPFIKPVEYPIAGIAPSPFKIGVVDISTAKTNWMNIPTDPVLQSYVPRMEWANNSDEIILQHLNRKQNVSDILLCNIKTGQPKTIYHETDSAWIDVLALWDEDYSYGGWDWLNNGKAFMWASEQDGWRHLYSISRDGKTVTKITNGNFDVMGISAIDEKNGYVYFLASPNNATQKYLYRTKLNGAQPAERISPANQNGFHEYAVSPNALFAEHIFSNHYTPYVREWISLPNHNGLDGNLVNEAIAKADSGSSNVQFFTIKNREGISMDGWKVMPEHFDSTKKYPVVFYVYTEPWGQNVKDEYGIAYNFLYNGNMAKDGYIYISIDNRGTPVPKGREWRKCIYRKIGRVNINDQADAAKQILQWPFVDTSRIAVWGWSGGGSATQNLMFQYPDIYKTGIAIAGVASQFTYDNIYQERYMGLPQEDSADFKAGSPLTYAKNLQGHLLLIHGTGDDNVHYQNMELLINELVKYGKQFDMMSYPNRTHSISEGPGTREHLMNLYTRYLREYCPPGGR